MFSNDDDTIAAISTPLGEGGIGIVRISGRSALTIAEKIFSSSRNKSLRDRHSFTLTRGYILDPLTRSKIDEVLISIMRSPRSYTKEDIVEINCHGGMISLRKILELVLKQGARLAEPGEFTKRAFLNGRIDLSQAEAVLDLIRSKTDESRRIAVEQLQGGLSEKVVSLRDRLTDICVNIEAYIDFPEDEIGTTSKKEMLSSMHEIDADLQKLVKTYDEARFFREGISTAIVGRPNVGKSSLLNALLQKDRAIVTEIPGTTRDVIEEYLNINGLPLRIMDTAGIREVHDVAETEGVKRSLKSIENADLVIAMFDQSEPLKDEDIEVAEKIRNKNVIITLNKCDLPTAIDENSLSSCIMNPASCILNISATRGDGIDELKDTILKSCLKNWRENREGVVVTNLRHRTAIESACESMGRAARSLTGNQPIEFIALEIRDSLDKLGEIVGAVTSEDILNKIFIDFCIGK
jgi:tRNA modification GTPase